MTAFVSVEPVTVDTTGYVERTTIENADQWAIYMNGPVEADWVSDHDDAAVALAEATALAREERVGLILKTTDGIYTAQDLARLADQHLALAKDARDHDEAVAHVEDAREAVRLMFALMFPDNPA